LFAETFFGSVPLIVFGDVFNAVGDAISMARKKENGF
jgi:hypothetical protein